MIPPGHDIPRSPQEMVNIKKLTGAAASASLERFKVAFDSDIQPWELKRQRYPHIFNDSCGNELPWELPEGAPVPPRDNHAVPYQLKGFYNSA